jgi:ribosome-binding factor A
MSKYREERLNSRIQEELAKIIARDIEIPGALLTLTEVNLTKKLDQATILVSVFPSEKAERVIEVLTKKTGDLRHALIKRIPIRVMPHIIFKIDHGPEKAAIIEKIVIEEEKNPASRKASQGTENE